MKKILSYLTSFTVICTLTACAKSTDDASVPAEKITIIQTLYKEEYVDFPEDMRSCERLGYVNDVGVRLIYEDKNRNYKYADYDDNMQVKSTSDLFSTDKIYHSRFHIGEDGTVTALVLLYESEYEFGSEEFFNNVEISYELRRISPEGEQTIINVNGMEEYYRFPESFIESFTMIGDKAVILTSDSYVIIDENGDIIESQSDIDNIVFGEDSDGNVIAGDRSGFTYLDSLTLNIPDNMNAYGEYLNMQQGIAVGHDGFKAFFMLNDGVFGLTEMNNVVEIMDYSDSLMTCSDYYEVIYAGKGKFAAIGHNDESSCLYVMNVRPDGYVMERSTVIMGTRMIVDSTQQELTAKYNRKSDSYIIEQKAYETLDDLKGDILAGSPPDMYCFWDAGDMNRLVNLGALADMYELSEKYGGFKKEDIMENVIKAYEYRNGLYMMSQDFSVDFMAGKSEIFENPHMNYDEFFKIVNNAPEDVYFTPAFQGTAKKDVFDLFCTYNVSQWVDFEKAECSFDSPEFVKLLNYIEDVPLLPELDWDELANMDDDERQIFYREDMHRVKNGTALVTFDTLFGLFSLDTFRETSGLDTGEYTFICPFGETAAGNIHSQAYYSIIANGNCPEGAWDYMNFLVSDNLLTTYLQTENNFVVRRESFEKIIENQKWTSENPRYVDENGITHENFMFSRPVADEEISMITDYIADCTVVKSQYQEIADIISEEYLAYEAGESTAEECGKLIQNRVSIYLSENL